MSKLKKLWEKAKQVVGTIAIVYPALQILLKLNGIELPELPPDWSAGGSNWWCCNASTIREGV